MPLVMVVLPVRSRKLYPEIKRWADCVIGIPTVCVLEKTLSKGGDRARCGNIRCGKTSHHYQHEDLLTMIE